MIIMIFMILFDFFHFFGENFFDSYHHDDGFLCNLLG